MSTERSDPSVTPCCSSNADIVVSLSSAPNKTDGGGTILVICPLVPMTVAPDEPIAIDATAPTTSRALKKLFISPLPAVVCRWVNHQGRALEVQWVAGPTAERDMRTTRRWGTYPLS